MTDRELLEAAAKAAGLDGWTYSPEDNAMRSPPKDTPYGPGCSYWAPLTDDADAFRLAVKLNLQVTPGTYRSDEASAFHAGHGEANERVHYLQDLAAATRRAIVRAAGRNRD